MKLFISSVISALACGFFAGLFVRGSIAWLIGLALVGAVGYGWVKAVTEAIPTINEEEA